MKQIFDKLIWIGLFLFFVPSTLVIASWNSLPGDFMFPIKLDLEKSLLVIVSPSYEISSGLQIKYTERRFADAQKLLAVNNSVKGLPYLDQQVETAKVAIENTSNSEARHVLANQYIASLTQVLGELEQQKLAITKNAVTIGSSGSPSQPTPTIIPSGLVGAPVVVPGQTTIFVTPTATQTQVVVTPKYYQKAPTTIPTPTSTPAPTFSTVVTTNGTTPPQNLVVALQITQTQRKISDAIDDLKKQGNNDNKPSDNKPSKAPDNQNNKVNKNNDK